jgi:hypothetical protein
MCTGYATLTFKPGVNGRLNGTYKKVWYTDRNGQAANNYEAAALSSQAGESFWLVRNDPHTLLAGGGSATDPDGPGNPYLCDSYAANHNATTYQLCGA